MKSKLKSWNKVLVSALAFLLVFVSVYSGYQVINAARRYMFEEKSELKEESKDSGSVEKAKAMSISSATNVFTILEVVPYHGMAEIGYMVGGEEPIDISKLNNPYNVGNTSYFGDMLIQRSTYVEKKVEDLTPKEQQEDAKFHNWKDIYVASIDTGYFEYSTDRNYVLYNREGWTHDTYIKVNGTEGSGKRYKAVLNKLNSYSQINGLQTSNKNVKAFFFNSDYDPNRNKLTKFNNDKFVVKNAEENTTHTGDYDYNYEKDVFFLNKGKGGYDVEFMASGYQANFGKEYYMSKKDYEIVEYGTGTYTGDISYVEDSSGDYKKVTIDADYSLANSGGTYRWNSVPGGDLKTDPRLVTHVVYKKYKCHYGCKYINTEWFKREGMRLDPSEFDKWDIDVVTVTPDELTEDLINKANLVFLSCEVQNRAYVGLWETFGKNKDTYIKNESDKYSACTINETTGSLDNVASFKPGKELPSFINHDMNWDMTVLLFKRIGIDRDLPAIFNSHIYETNQTELDGKANSTSNNFAKLYIMLRQQDPEQFYNTYFNDIIKKDYKGVSTGWYTKKTGKAQYIWCSETFLPLYSGGIGPGSYYESIGIDNYNMDGNNSVVDDIYTTKSDCIIDGNFIKKNDEYKGKWFYDVQKFIFLYENPDYVGTPSESEIANQRLSPSDIIFYLLNNLTEKKLNLPNFTVLDLEPCKDYTLTEDMVKKMVPSYTGTINIVRMTTAEFNGKNEDLNSTYDMIYIGLNDGMFYKDSNGTKYNDSSLNKKVYLHVGDKIVGGMNLRGLENGTNQYNTYRFSGNDITSRKLQELKDYLNSGLPIIIDDELYDLNIKIDPASRIYDFISNNKGVVPAKPTKLNEMNNMINEKLFSMSTTKNVAIAKVKDCLINYEKPRIEFVSNGKPVGYDENTITTLKTDNQLVFKFQIKQYVLPASVTDNQKYTVTIYIDKNANGIYGDQADERLFPAISNLSANQDITISKVLPVGCNGFVPWKLEVQRQDDVMIRNNEMGFSAIKIDTKKQIKVLQITSTVNPGFSSITGSTINLEDEMKTSSKFKKYATNLNDFDFEFKTIDVEKFEKLYEDEPESTPTSTNKYVRGTLCNDPLTEYDMIILGFGDYYTNISNENGAVDNIFDYIESGKSVIFTRDTTSMINKYSTDSAYTSGVPNWGYNMNQYLRSRIGMKRFDINTFTSVPSIELEYQSAFDNHDHKDFADIPGGGEYEKQGFSYSTLCQYSIASGETIPSSMLPTGGIQRGPYNTVPISNIRAYYQSRRITNVNVGQITEYPYKIPRSGVFDPSSSTAQYCNFEVSNSHAQYYELDLEDPQMVVWYCLSNEATNKVYSCSPNDVRNNYYIYNKGNVTYTGVGDSDFITNDMEIKLFVNTMVATYMASTQPPDIKIVNGIEKSSQESLLPISLDYNDQQANIGDTIKIEFIVEDEKEPSGIANIKVYDENNNDLGLIVYDKDDNVVNLNEVITHKDASGNYPVYYINYPKEKLDNKDTCQLMITAKNTMYTGKEVVKILRRNLFNLN